MNRLAAILLAASALSQVPAEAGEKQHDWTYAGEQGPDHWGDLKAEYSLCTVGQQQSPIDIRNPLKAVLPAIRFDYKDTPLKLIDNGHTIQVNYAPGSVITVGDRRYELKQFHFHHPSEERIQGRSYDMVVHLVHAGSDGKLAVVAVLLERGSANQTIKEIWARLPKTKNTEQESREVWINAAGLLPHGAAYYTYFGSLTTPPCSEGVTWLVLRTPVAISPDQINAFATIYPHNTRPIRPIGNRVVKASE